MLQLQTLPKVRRHVDPVADQAWVGRAKAMCIWCIIMQIFGQLSPSQVMFEGLWWHGDLLMLCLVLLVWTVPA